MKKLIILLFVTICISLQGYSQCNLPYKPLTEFRNDTTGFLTYNFIERSECYKGKTFKEFVNDLNMPIILTLELHTRGKQRLSIYIRDYEETEDRNRNRGHNIGKNSDIIEIIWDSPINEALEAEMRGEEFYWSDKMFQFYKNLRIKETYVELTPGTKYYFKYQDVEAKRSAEYTDQ